MALQKRRRLDDDPAEELATLNDDPSDVTLPSHLKEEPVDANVLRINLLEAKLQHLRRWMQSVQNQLQAQPAHKDTVYNSRRLFIGDVPFGTADEDLSSFLSDAIIASGAAISSTGRPLVYCRKQPDKSFAFVELRSAEEASNTLALDGIMFRDVPLKVKRPSKYEPHSAILLGPLEPDPTMDLSKVNIHKPQPAAPAPAAEGEVVPAGKYEATNNTLYIGGLPIEWTAEQCMELLRVYGEVTYFKLMYDRQTGNSRGFAFAEYSTDESTKAALAALDGAQLGPRRITANRMLEHKEKEKRKQFQQQQQQQHQQHQQQQWGGQMGAGGMGSGSLSGSGSGGFTPGWGSSRQPTGVRPMTRQSYGGPGGMGVGGMGGAAAADGMMIPGLQAGARIPGLTPAAGAGAAAAGMDGMMAGAGVTGGMVQGASMMAAPAAPGGMQQAAGSTTAGGGGGGYGTAMIAGQYRGGAAAAAAAVSGVAAGAMPGGALGTNMQPMNGSLQGMYAMPNAVQQQQQPASVGPASHASDGYADGTYGSNTGLMQQQSAAMYNAPGQTQPGYTMGGIDAAAAAAGMGAVPSSAAGGGALGAAGIWAYGQQPQQLLGLQQQQQLAYLSANLGQMPQVSAGMQAAAAPAASGGSLAGMHQQQQQNNMQLQSPLGTGAATGPVISGALSAGMGGALLGGWQGQQQHMQQQQGQQQQGQQPGQQQWQQ